MKHCLGVAWASFVLKELPIYKNLGWIEKDVVMATIEIIFCVIADLDSVDAETNRRYCWGRKSKMP